MLRAYVEIREFMDAMLAGRPDVPDSRSSAMDAYKDLYKGFVDSVIHLSEAKFVLQPQYLHLHERDFGYIGNYRLWRYPAAFVETLGDLRSRFNQIVFCYSRETNNATEPRACVRDQFFYYVLDQVEQKAIDGSVFRHPNGHAEEGPFIESIDHRLRAALEGCSLIQPYILCLDRAGELQFDYQLRDIDELDNLISPFKQCGYQFSIYGYQLKEGAALSPVEKHILELAFLTHVWTWNHDLARAHEVRKSFLSNFDHAKVRWSEASKAVVAAFSEIERLSFGAEDPFASTILPMPDDVWEKELYPAQSEVLPHVLEDLTDDKYRTFITKVQECGRRGHTELASFVRYAGGLDMETDSTSTEKFKTRSRAIWLAVKLLTRHILSPGSKYVWPDQILLAILFGVARAEAQGIEVAVRYQIPASYLGSDSPEQAVAKYCEIRDVAGEVDDSCWWPESQWKVARGEHDGEMVCASWAYDTNGGSNSLKSYLASGLMRCPNEHFGPVVPVLVFGRQVDQASEVALLLGNLASLAYTLALARRRELNGMLTLSRIEVDFTISGTPATRSSRAEIRFGCAGSLGRDPDPAQNHGQLFGPLNRIAAAMGLGKVVRAGITAARETGPGIFIDRSHEGEDQGRTLFWLALESAPRRP